MRIERTTTTYRLRRTLVHMDMAGRHPGAILRITLQGAALPAIFQIHDRMPVVLISEHFNAWMDPNTPKQAVQEMIADSHSEFTIFTVSTRVNNTRNDLSRTACTAQSMTSLRPATTRTTFKTAVESLSVEISRPTT